MLHTILLKCGERQKKVTPISATSIWLIQRRIKKSLKKACISFISGIACSNCFLPHPQGLSGPQWQQLASRPFSVSAGRSGPEAPPARADAIFKVTMLPGDGVGPELMTAVKEVFKVQRPQKL